MKRNARVQHTGRVAIGKFTDQGMAQMSEMNPYLVRPPRHNANTKHAVMRRCRQRGDKGARLLTLRHDSDNLPPLSRTGQASDRSTEFSRRTRPMTVTHRQVVLMTTGQPPPHSRHESFSLHKEIQTRRATIQLVNRPKAITSQLTPKLSLDRIQIGRDTASRRNTRRLINDQDTIVTGVHRYRCGFDASAS